MKIMKGSLSEKLLPDFGGDSNHAHHLPYLRPSLLTKSKQ
jgi:hypothetical protein